MFLLVDMPPASALRGRENFPSEEIFAHRRFSLVFLAKGV
jgi:hypothetical protein